MKIGPVPVAAGWDAAASGLGLVPRCGAGDGRGGLPVTSAQTGLRARFQAWRWGLDQAVRDIREAIFDCSHARA